MSECQRDVIKHRAMGVVNITPDSFSDGGKYDKISKLKEKISDLLNFNVKILDFGAESTAPFNSKISEDEELKRFEKTLFKIIEKKEIPIDVIFSIDTYKISTFKEVYKKIKEFYPENKIIWNDVSGVIDSPLISVLKEFTDIHLVYSHTKTKDRENSTDHMSEVFEFDESKALGDLTEYFKKASECFKREQVLDRVIFDPSFGFSKRATHNFFIIKNISKLVKEFPCKQRWLLGISRKSFLKGVMDLESLESSRMVQTEYLQVLILNNWIKELHDYNIIYRIHDPSIFNALKQFYTFIS